MLNSQEINCENHGIKSPWDNKLQGKSFLLSIFCCVRCILYPGSKVCIAAGTRGQSVNIIEKIKMELLPRSELLKNEISTIRISATDSSVIFKNASYIKVVTASDSARGNRANILLVDEFRMVKKDTVDTILRKFLTNPRSPGYLDDPQYAHLKERNKEIYLSSAYFQDSWAYDKLIDYAQKMLDETKRYFVCGLPYHLSIKEGLLSKESVEEERCEVGFNEIRFSCEMECLFWGSADGSFFDYEVIAGCRKIPYPWLPDDMAERLGNSRKLKIPVKQNGEKRLLSADLALMASTRNNNDASSYFINQLLPTKSGRYINSIMYTESSEGMHTSDQALRLRRLYEMYRCDYIVIDCKGE